MRVFVYEHLCTLPEATSSLRAEGWAMLSAAVADFAVCDGVTPVVMVEPGLVDRVTADAPKVEVHRVSEEIEASFRLVARDCAFALVIAPEFDDILATRCEWALESGCKLLGPSPEAVRLCADKLRLAAVLQAQEIPAPATTLYDLHNPPGNGYPYVVKPRIGAGTTATFRVRSPDEFVSVLSAARAQGFKGELIVQPICRGIACSVSAITRHTDRGLTLPPAEQRVETTSPAGQFRYLGGAVPAPPGFGSVVCLAQHVTGSVAGLSGYYGIDLVNGGWDDSVVIEINPRLTTSYVGLRRLSNINLMQVLLDVVQGKEPPQLSWRNANIRFDPDGTIHEHGDA